MMATVLLKTVTFGSFDPSPSPGYTVYNADGTTYAARSTSGIVQPVSGQNMYAALISVPDTYILMWDDGNSPATYAIDGGEAGASATTVQVTIVNPIPT